MLPSCSAKVGKSCGNRRESASPLCARKSMPEFSVSQPTDSSQSRVACGGSMRSNSGPGPVLPVLSKVEGIRFW